MTKDFTLSTEWYEESWHYRKEVSILGGVYVTEPNYQVRIPVPYNAHMQTDFDDICFRPAGRPAGL